jgi:hypothetical protein
MKYVLLFLIVIGFGGCTFLTNLKNGKFDFSVSDLTIAFAIYFVATRAYRKFKDGKEDGDGSTPHD